MLTMEKPRMHDEEIEEKLLSPRQAVAFLQELWGQPVTVTSFRMLRLRRKDDPGMPGPDFEDGDMLLWKPSTLRKIKPPKRYNR